jgi:hypothetical protein
VRERTQETKKNEGKNEKCGSTPPGCIGKYSKSSKRKQGNLKA